MAKIAKNPENDATLLLFRTFYFEKSVLYPGNGLINELQRLKRLKEKVEEEKQASREGEPTYSN